MRVRAVHVAGLILLLASLGLAEGPSARDGACVFSSHYIGVLLAQDLDPATIHADLIAHRGDALQFALPVQSLAHYRAAWTMRPPSSQAAQTHAVTGLAA